MKKVILTIFMALIFVVACGEDSKTTGVAEITVNGQEFNKSVSCSATPGENLVISIGATNEAGDTISIGTAISKDGENYKYVDGDGFDITYTEGTAKQYSATDEDGGSFTGSFKKGIVTLSFDVTAKLNGFGIEKKLKGTIKCTPGGATN